jgi:hypothetical protein
MMKPDVLDLKDLLSVNISWPTMLLLLSANLCKSLCAKGNCPGSYATNPCRLPLFSPNHGCVQITTADGARLC